MRLFSVTPSYKSQRFTVLLSLVVVDISMSQPFQSFQESVIPCTPELILYRNAVSTSAKPGASMIGCFRRCVSEAECDVAVFQTYSGGATACTTLTPFRTDSAVTTIPVDWTTSLTCRLLIRNDSFCQNGGSFAYGMCACTDDYMGEWCELQTPSGWPTRRQWTIVATAHGSNSNSHTIHNQTIVDDYVLRYDCKVKIRDSEFKTTAIITSTYTESSLSFTSNYMLEKSQWNRLTVNGKRLLRLFYVDGGTANATFDGTYQGHQTSEALLEFQFLSTTISMYPGVLANDVDKNADFLNLIEKGYKVLEFNCAVNNKPTVVLQSTALVIGSAQSSFSLPLRWHNYKNTIGGANYFQRQIMSEGTYMGPPRKTNRYNYHSYDPHWLTPLGNSINQATVKAISYMYRGHRFRVNAGDIYLDALVVIRFGSEVWFILNHYLSNTAPGMYDYADGLAVSTVASLSGSRDACTYVLEGEAIQKHEFETGIDVQFFVDTLTWNRVFSVYSNSSVAYGSLSELAQDVLSGFSVRVLVQWLSVDKEALFDTHMNSVTDDMKVSSESFVTWRLADPDSPDVRLSPLCDFEYTLMTTDGFLQVATYDIWTPVQLREETDVLMTWFTG